MTPSTVALRSAPAWLRPSLLSVLVIAVCWPLALGYWHINGHLPTGSELLIGLFFIPLVVFGACWAADTAIRRRADAVRR